MGETGRNRRRWAILSASRAQSKIKAAKRRAGVTDGFRAAASGMTARSGADSRWRALVPTRAVRTRPSRGHQGGGEGGGWVLGGGHADIGGRRMARPQRRPASLRAFPQLGLVMRRPGMRAASASTPVSPVFMKWNVVESEGGIAHRAWGQCRACDWRRGGGARGRGADRSEAE